VAIGHTFKGNQPHSKRALPHVADELEQIRAACGAEILLDEAATEPAFARAAKEARWLHIATHGRNRTAAPAFQTVYLHPDADSDGRLCAYEVLAHDLRGVDLVTLSACETALGRIDISDNPRGLPACLFLAGASTIIGTLWEVNSEASALFFSTLYKRLAKGESKLAAFRTAQQVTRKQFPAYCHWGAFQYSGAW